MSKNQTSQTETIRAPEAEELSETELESVVGGAVNAFSIQRDPAATTLPLEQGGRAIKEK